MDGCKAARLVTHGRCALKPLLGYVRPSHNFGSITSVASKIYDLKHSSNATKTLIFNNRPYSR
ncbi:hypothetical protein B0O99DRAFT_643662 [Bisporella sp. PMI_857]|nr:hypothetical protein B0O99DRAFT_643662 [Bisporella sp. PMI_857]